MDQTQARALLAGERARLQRLLQAETGEPQAAELGDEVHAARRNAEHTGMAVDQLLRARWAALRRAEAAGRRPTRAVGASGRPIPDERGRDGPRRPTVARRRLPAPDQGRRSVARGPTTPDLTGSPTQPLRPPPGGPEQRHHPRIEDGR